MTHIANMIAELRVLVALLGEQQQAGWWASQFYSPTATAFLAPIFHRSLFQAQYQGATAAAAKAHDETIGVGRIFHLFRLPIGQEQAAADSLLDDDFARDVQVWRDMQQRFRDYLQKPLGDRKLTSITRTMIARALSEVEKAGKAAATVKLVRALASGIFGRAIEWGYLETNPAQGVKVAGRTVSRDRFLQADELPRFFQSLAEEPSITMRDFILLALLTDARRANLCAMRWPEISLADSVWRIPDTKNGTPQNVTLCPEAVEILKARQEATGGGFVFPGPGASGHMVEPKNAVIRVMKRAAIPYGRNDPNGVTLHDLRRTLGSWQARSGASLAIIGTSLNHKSQQATAISARLDLDPVRASVNTATSAMLEAGGMKAAAEVGPINSERLKA